VALADLVLNATEAEPRFAVAARVRHGKHSPDVPLVLAADPCIVAAERRVVAEERVRAPLRVSAAGGGSTTDAGSGSASKSRSLLSNISVCGGDTGGLSLRRCVAS
jgi:hypothetical protein